MQTISNLFAFGILTVWSAWGAAANAGPPATGADGDDGMTLTVPKPTDAVLFNPRMGLYMQYPPLELPSDHWMMRIADIAYYRLDWAEVNPEEGVYRFDEYFEPRFEKWVRREHKRVAFRVMSSNMHSRREYVTPKWVFDQGVPSVTHQSVYGGPQTDPVFWDKRYLDIQCRFIAALGEYLAGRDGLEFLDIGAIGEWGEMHLSRWTPEQLAATGYTHTRYVEAYRRIIDAYADAFPRTPVFLNVGGRNNLTIDDYAAARGLHFRQDGLKPDGASYNCGDWLYKMYEPRGVLCNFEFFSGYRGMVRKGWDLKQTIDAGLSAPISYLNTNLGTFGENVPDIVKAELTRAGRHLGYRLMPVRIRHPRKLTVYADMPARFEVSCTWRNDGIARPTLSFAEEWAVADVAGKVLTRTRSYPPIPTTLWAPGKEFETSVTLAIPAGLADGEYHLLASLVQPETGRRIRLGIEGRRTDGWYDICPLRSVREKAPPAILGRWTFESGTQGWSASAAGIHVAVAKGTDAEGNDHWLRVFGHKEKAWNYAAVSLPAPQAIPYGTIRLTGRMRVVKLRPAGASAPYFKIGVNDRDGKWITNFMSSRYDRKRLGEWQTLTVLVPDLPAAAGQLAIAVETGDYHAAIEVDLQIDDLKLEIVPYSGAPRADADE